MTPLHKRIRHPGEGGGIFVLGKSLDAQNIARPALSFNMKGKRMTHLQLLYLRRLHGLTEAQAQAIAALIWGAV